MNTEKTKKALLIASLSVNGMFFALFALALFQKQKTSSVSFLDMNGNDPYTTGAYVVSVPERGADIVFGPADISLKSGETAHAQFSAVYRGRQLTVAAEPLYDHEIVAVEKSPFGFFIHALKPGQAALQTFSDGAFRDLLRVTVLPLK